MLDFTQLGNLESIKYQSYDGSIKEIVPERDLAFGSDSIPFETQAIEYYNVVQLTEKVNRQLEELKLGQNRISAQLYNKFVADPAVRASNGGKKPSDTMINNLVTSDDSYIRVSQAVLKTQYNYSSLKGLAKAYEQRKDLMQSLSAQKRSELGIGNNTAFTGDQETLMAQWKANQQ